MKFRKVKAVFAGLVVFGVAVAPIAAQSATYSGRATCPPLVVGGVSAEGYNSTPSIFMQVTVGNSVKNGTGHAFLKVQTNSRTANWSVTGDAVRSGTGYCEPR